MFVIHFEWYSLLWRILRFLSFYVFQEWEFLECEFTLSDCYFFLYLYVSWKSHSLDTSLYSPIHYSPTSSFPLTWMWVYNCFSVVSVSFVFIFPGSPSLYEPLKFPVYSGCLITRQSLISHCPLRSFQNPVFIP